MALWEKVQNVVSFISFFIFFFFLLLLLLPVIVQSTIWCIVVLNWLVWCSVCRVQIKTISTSNYVQLKTALIFPLTEPNVLYLTLEMLNRGNWTTSRGEGMIGLSSEIKENKKWITEIDVWKANCNTILTCICDTGRHSLRSCRTHRGWQGQTHCTAGTEGSPPMRSSCRRSRHTRSWGWRPRWAAGTRAWVQFGRQPTHTSWPCAKWWACNEKLGQIVSIRATCITATAILMVTCMHSEPRSCISH